MVRRSGIGVCARAYAVPPHTPHAALRRVLKESKLKVEVEQWWGAFAPNKRGGRDSAPYQRCAAGLGRAASPLAAVIKRLTLPLLTLTLNLDLNRREAALLFDFD